MMRFLMILIGTLGFTVAPAFAQYDKLSPFSAIRWNGEVPEVEYDRTWYGLHSIDGQPIDEMLKFCKNRYQSRWDKRFCEDLVQVLSEMGHRPGRSVKLVLVDLKSGKKRTVARAAMTAGNRESIRRDRPRAGESAATVNRVERKHAKRADRRYKFLTTRYHDEDARPTLTAEQAREDLDQLEWQLENTFSYLELKTVDHRAALDTVRAELGESISLADYHIQLRKLIGLFGDGHSRARGVMGALPRGFAPLRFVDLGERIAALHPEKAELLDEGFPYLRAMDGVALEKWIAQASNLAAQGSPQFVRREALRYLCWVEAIRKDLGLRSSERIELTLESEDGKRTRKVTRSLGRSPSFSSISFPRKSTVLDGNIGYLRIPTMSLDLEDLRGLERTMKKLLDTRGLILDVRGNGGGNRLALRLLFPYFMSEEDAPHVGNVAAYRLPPGVPAGHPSGYLSDRMLFPAGFEGWNDAQREAIRNASRGFKPGWKPDPKKFSDWHYLVLDRSEGRSTTHYDRPVVLLIDNDCYSATDIFVGAFKGWRNVTVMGTATGGGSGRSKEFTLAHSRIKVKLSTMASFRPSGRLYDGNGIEPDVEARPTLADHLGRSDSVLDRAIALLQGS